MIQNALINLMQIKSILVNYLDKIDFDKDSVEYVLNNIDYLIQGKIPCTKEVLKIMLEDILVTGTYHKSNVFLKIAAILNQILKEFELCMK